MADHAHSPQQAPARALNIAMAVCLLLAAGALVSAVLRAPKVPEITAASFAITAPTVDAERLAADRAKHYGKIDITPADAAIVELEKFVRQANEAQFGGADGQGAHELQILTLHHANEVITSIGIEGFVPAGKGMFDACATAFDEVLAAVKSGKLTIEQAETDPGEAFAAYRSNCGNAFGALRKSGVLDDSGAWADPVSGPLVFDIMNRFRWAAVLDMRRQPASQLSPYEYEILTRWRISMTTVPVPKRVEWVIAAERALPKFPRHELLGNLLLESGDAVGALGAYDEACASRRTDIELQRKCEFLRKQVGGAEAGH